MSRAGKKQSPFVSTATECGGNITRIKTSTAKPQSSVEWSAITGFGLDYYDRSRSVPKFCRNVARDHIHGCNRIGIERTSEQAIDTVRCRHPIHNVECAVVHSANMHQAIVFGIPSWNGRNDCLQLIASDYC